MNAKTTRMLKEARPLLWPWCGVIIAGVLPLVPAAHSIAWISPIGFFAGIPLLASLSLGNEFQHRTLSLLLAQPIDRMEIWGEKLSVTVVAVLSAALVFFVAWRVAAHQLVPEDPVIAGAWIIGTIASATFWTLFARSTPGGLALNMAVHTVILVAWANLPERIRLTGYPSTASLTFISIAAFVFLCYAGVMLWLGRRTLARFQVMASMAGDDLLMAGPHMMPGVLTGWLRCRPNGVVLNLIRKELRLLRPLWLITLLAAALLAVLGWIWLTLFGLAPERGSTKSLPAAVGMVGGFSSLLIAILAGSLSLGEERTSGRQSWHMTQPVSVRRQWLIKLSVAMFASFVCAVLLPVLVLIAGGILWGSPLMFVTLQVVITWVLTVLLVSFASFWCACAVNGTVRAALSVFPVMGALILAGQFSGWVAGQLMDLVVSRFDPFADFKFTNAVSNIQMYSREATPTLVATLFLVPALLFAVIQSYRLFRAQPQDSPLSVIRYLLPLAIIAFLCGLSLAASFLFVENAKQQMWTMFRETHEAIEKIQPGAAKLDAAHPLQLTVEDLAKASPLSERTRLWLANSSITVAPDKPHPGPYCCGGNSRISTLLPNRAYLWYLVTIHRPSGPDCTVLFQGGRGIGILGGVCK